jgi:amidase
LRTSLGCVPHGPTDDVFFQQFGVAGPMGRTIPDLAMLLSVQAGFDSRLPLSRPSHPAQFSQPLERDFTGTRIGWLGSLGCHLPMEPGLLDLCKEALSAFETVGCHVEPAALPFDYESLWRAWIDLRSFSVAGNCAALYENREKRALLKSEAIWEIKRGLQLSAMDVFRATRVRSAWYQAMRALFERYDFLVMPANQVFPFDADLDWPAGIAGRAMSSYHRWLEAMIPATLAGLPTLSAPAGFGPTGLPAGLQIIGPAQADWAVLQMGHAYDQAAGHARIRSPLLE